jgi:phosphoglycolate phosphatase
MVSAVLFDLDGTLIDSAPGLAATTNLMLAQRARAPMPLAHLRPHAGSGARGMLVAAFGVGPADPRYDALRDEFYVHYAEHMLHDTRPFEAVECLLQALDDRGVPWGIVTNKALRFAEPTARALGLLPRAAALVAGDSTPHTKPHPEPLLEAARRLRCPPQACAYVGDDPRDVRAGRAAGMATVAASWGYLGVEAPVHEWGADAVLAAPGELLTWLDMA